MRSLLPSFTDEMAKIAISVRDSAFMQTRKGRRPIRVHNAILKENAFKTPKEDSKEDSNGSNAASHESEMGSGMQESLGG